MEEILAEAAQVLLYPMRSADSWRPFPTDVGYLQQHFRKGEDLARGFELLHDALNVR